MEACAEKDSRQILDILNGVIRQAGFKFGRWLDLVFMQKILPTPAIPVDG